MTLDHEVTYEATTIWPFLALVFALEQMGRSIADAMSKYISFLMDGNFGKS